MCSVWHPFSLYLAILLGSFLHMLQHMPAYVDLHLSVSVVFDIVHIVWPSTQLSYVIFHAVYS